MGRGSPDVGESESYECEGEDIQSDKSCEEFLNSGSECEESDQTDGGAQGDSSFSVATSPDLCFVSASNDPIQRPHSSDLYPSSSLTQAISDQSLDTVAENDDSEKEKDEETNALVQNEVFIQCCLIENETPNIAFEKKMDEQPSYISTLIEESRRRDYKTLSDGGAFENYDSNIKRETSLCEFTTTVQKSNMEDLATSTDHQVASNNVHEPTFDTSAEETEHRPNDEEKTHDSDQREESEEKKSEDKKLVTMDGNHSIRNSSSDVGRNSYSCENPIKRPESCVRSLTGHLDEGKLADLSCEDLSLPGV